MNAAEITDKLGLHNLRQRKWHTQVRHSIISLNNLCSLRLKKPLVLFGGEPKLCAAIKAENQRSQFLMYFHHEL